MATLVLSVLGTAIGGPIGQTIGAIIGNQIDRAIFSPGGSREGPRLKELAITTSSYGQPIPRQFGRMRVGGTVIWATDIRESAAREGGGKGRPSTTTYSYSASFAVALSSTPLARIGRVWADGNLLRGAGGDLKVAGQMRTYLGTGNDPVDPVIAADKGAQAPAFRDCAYVVFEDLALADFGNRIPVMTFEVFAPDEDQVTIDQLVPGLNRAIPSTPVSHTRGFADEGGALLRSLAAINEVLPLSCVTVSEGVRITPVDQPIAAVHPLPPRLASIDDVETRERSNRRGQGADTAPLALRYYDEGRDYQPGVQRAVGMRPNGLENMIDLPATMTASGARQLANENAQRARWRRERTSWRIGVLDPKFQPGSMVALPDAPGVWRVTSWEWFERGIELELERMPPQSVLTLASDAGEIIGPADLTIPPTVLEFFEAPPDGSSPASVPLQLVAASAESVGWRGASLYAEQGSSLMPIGSASADRAVIGRLLEPLAPSPSHWFEPSASVSIELAGEGLALEPATLEALASGANRLMVGGEVLQFAEAQPLAGRAWRITGLLRGRAGTEDAAAVGHDADTAVVLLDGRATILDSASTGSLTTARIAAIGRGDDEPVYADLRNAGLSRRPPSPVHPRLAALANSDWELCWTRRARGAWRWDDSVETPLIEESESYLVGYGDMLTPFAVWTTQSAQITFSIAERTALVADHGPDALWVRQIGTYATSPALLLTHIN